MVKEVGDHTSNAHRKLCFEEYSVFCVGSTGFKDDRKPEGERCDW